MRMDYRMPTSADREYRWTNDIGDAMGGSE
jgi:hypothetical protein